MNVFLLDTDPLESVSYYVDDHVAYVTTGAGRKPIRSCKMAIEGIQLLSTAHWFPFSREERLALFDRPKSEWPAPYKPTHDHHPWAVAVRSSRAAYNIVREHVQAMLIEHEHRTGTPMAGVQADLDAVWEAPDWVGSHGWRVPVCRTGQPVEYVSSVANALPLYRQAYIDKVSKMPRFTGRTCPEWARS